MGDDATAPDGARDAAGAGASAGRGAAGRTKDARSGARGGAADWAQPVLTGMVIAFIGYAGSVAIVIQGLSGAGATTGQIASALTALALAKAGLAIVLSWWLRMPVSIAWTTPGMALLAAGPVAGPLGVEGGFPAVVGAFMVTGALIVLAGSWGPLARAIRAIPASLANGMLAGVLLPLCLVPFTALGEAPGPILAVLGLWLLAGRVHRLAGMPAAALGALVLLWPDLTGGDRVADAAWPRLEAVLPVLTLEAVLSIALPLFLVTMASQNIPGLAIMRAHGYRPPPGRLIAATGGVSAPLAPFGMPSVNLAAITAALACGPDAHPDPARRWRAALAAGLGYLAFGLLAGVTAGLAEGGVPVLVTVVAGLGLMGAFAGALDGAVREPADRPAAVLALLVTAGGVTVAGIGGAFWGLVAGAALLALTRPRRGARGD